MAKRKKYSVGTINGEGRVFRFSTLRGAETEIARIEKFDPEGVARGDYYIDGPEAGRIELPKGKTANERAKENAEERVLAAINKAGYNPWLNVSDETLAEFDNALNAAETVLQELLPILSPARITELFKVAVDIHLCTELESAKKYGNDCEAFRDAVNEGRESAF